jgi:DNA-binding transcriptional regulator YiaG
MQNEILSEAQATLGLNKQDMARALGVHYNTYGKWSRGEQNPPAVVYTTVELLLFIEKNQLLLEWLARNEPVK